MKQVLANAIQALNGLRNELDKYDGMADRIKALEKENKELRKGVVSAPVVTPTVKVTPQLPPAPPADPFAAARAAGPVMHPKTVLETSPAETKVEAPKAPAKPQGQMVNAKKMKKGGKK